VDGRAALKIDIDKPILLLGPTAIHGHALVLGHPDKVQAIHNTNEKDALRLGWPYIELEDASGIAELLRDYTGTIVYAHAVCDVARCEGNPDWARQKNIQNLVGVIQSHNPGARFVYLSSDHLFGNDGTYDEDCEPSPISEYGRTRVGAERIALEVPGSVVIRVPLSLGPSVSGRIGHLDWIRYRHEKGLPITIIADEARSAVSSADVADRVVSICESDITGLRHIAATRSVSRPELADAVFAYHGLPALYDLATRADQPAPHLGRVTMATRYDDAWSQPLLSAADAFAPAQTAPSEA
jgi:dTDP-4-dehydrorhamnose reductase